MMPVEFQAANHTIGVQTRALQPRYPGPSTTNGMEPTMTSFQRHIIAWIDHRCGGRALVAGQWISIEDVHQDAKLAELLYWEIV